LTLITFLTASLPSLAQEDIEEAAENRLWLPQLSFPPSDPTKEAGSLPLWGRDISFSYLGTNWYLSKKRGLELTFDNNDFYLRASGRIYMDLTHYNDEKNDLGRGGFGIRTALLELTGRFTEGWQYRLSFGGLTEGGRFDGSGAFIDDAYVAHVKKDTAWVLGQQGEPFSLEAETSSLVTTFMERALPYALVPGTTLGVSYNVAGERWGINGWGMKVGVFGENLATEKDEGDQGYGFTGRFFYRSGALEEGLHLGGSASWRYVPSSGQVFFRYRPESGLTDVRYVDTGDILKVENLLRMGLEGALKKGPLCLQGEYIVTRVDRENPFDDVTFDGWYAFLSWFATGESRKYFYQEGIFGYPDIQSKYGALELAVRYSTIDLTDGLVKGGKEDNLTFGINWYITPKIRLMGNYIFVFADDDADGDGALDGDDRPQIIQLRLQLRI
jgi:phosphate-selective porin OprO/OprP